MADKNYIKGIFIKEIGLYGNLSVNLKMKDFLASIKPLENKKGYVSLKIEKKREPGKYGDTHYCVENTWEPPAKPETNSAAEEESSDLPF